MPHLLRASSLVVGKSGGLTIAEAAVAGAPMVVLDPIPGQETRNADALLNAQCASKVNDLPLLAITVDAALQPARLAAAAAAIRQLGRPHAAFTVADALLRGSLRRHPGSPL